MKIRLSQLFFVLSQPKLSVHLKILFSMFFKEAIVILSSMYCNFISQGGDPKN